MRLKVLDTILITAISNQPLRPMSIIDVGEADGAAVLKSHPHTFLAVGHQAEAPQGGTAAAKPKRQKPSKAD